jgi:branched-chain amino acid transport system ATP-binding protein
MHKNFFWQAVVSVRRANEEIEHRKVEEIIDFLEIQHIRKTPVGRLPYGLQKRVELGRALAMEPELLLLDEPMAGMNLEEKEDMSRFILDVNQQIGTTIALIEHDMGVVMDLSDRVVVLDYGKKIADGPPDEVQATRMSSTPIWECRTEDGLRGTDMLYASSSTPSSRWSSCPTSCCRCCGKASSPAFSTR